MDGPGIKIDLSTYPKVKAYLEAALKKNIPDFTPMDLSQQEIPREEEHGGENKLVAFGEQTAPVEQVNTQPTRKKRQRKDYSVLPKPDRVLRPRNRSASLLSNTDYSSDSLVSVNQHSQAETVERTNVNEVEVSSVAVIPLTAWTALPHNETDFSASQMMELKRVNLPSLLPPIDPALFSRLAKFNKFVSTYNSTKYSAGEGFLLRSVSGYYSTLPFIGHSVTALRIIHRFGLLAGKTEQDGQDFPEQDETYAGCVESSLLVKTAGVLGQLIFTPTEFVTETLDEMMSLAQQVARIDEIQVGDVDVRNCFSVIGHVVEIAQEFSPPPEFLRYSALIVDFVDAVANGVEPKEFIKMKFAQKCPSKPRADTRNMHGMLSDKEKEANKGKRVELQQSKESGDGSLRTLTFSSKERTAQAFVQVPEYVPFRVGGGSELREQQPRKTTGSSGKKRTHDASNFVTQSVFTEFSNSQRVFNDQILAHMKKVSKRVEEMSDVIGSFNTSLVDTISRLAYSDLCKRVVDNAGKLDVKNPADKAYLKEAAANISKEMQQVIRRAPMMGVATMSSDKQEIIKALQSPNFSATQAVLYLPKIKGYLAGTANESAGSTLTDKKLMNVGLRSRLAEMLVSIPEKEADPAEAGESFIQVD